MPIAQAIAVVVLVALGSLAWTASAFAGSPPSIESESASHITPTDATLEAQVNPNGAYTGYEFQIDTNSSYNVPRAACPFDLPGYAECDALVTGEPLPPGLIEPSPAYIPASSGGESVSLDLASIGATLQPDTTYHYRVIAGNGGNPIAAGPDRTFTTPSASAPSIESESATNLSEHDATLEAQINPQSLERAALYQFQVVRNSSEYLSKFACPTEGGPAHSSLCLGLDSQASALPFGWTPAAVQDQPASLDLSATGMSLQPDTTYHYRVITARSIITVDNIAWEGPIVYGPDQTFTTPAAGSPSIEGESISKITPTDATLEAQINTEGLESTYNFYLQEAPLCFKANPPCERPSHKPLVLPSGKLNGSLISQSVSADLNSAGVGLSPGEHYEYWVTATNSAGTTQGRHQEFTASSEPSPSNAQNSGTVSQLSSIQSPPPDKEAGVARRPRTSSTSLSNHRHYKRHRHRAHRARRKR